MTAPSTDPRRAGMKRADITHSAAVHARTAAHEAYEAAQAALDTHQTNPAAIEYALREARDAAHDAWAAATCVTAIRDERLLRDAARVEQQAAQATARAEQHRRTADRYIDRAKLPDLPVPRPEPAPQAVRCDWCARDTIEATACPACGRLLCTGSPADCWIDETCVACGASAMPEEVAS